jgi:hypothetical protein
VTMNSSLWGQSERIVVYKGKITSKLYELTPLTNGMKF